jgi:catechol 2,3-dioxygenase-like lactoylglutathione lyase family enzyme
MKVERIDRVAIVVKDFEKARRFFEDILGIQFPEPRIGVGGKAAVSARPGALELWEPNAFGIEHAGLAPEFSEGIYSIVFRVDDLDEAVAEMKGKGLHPIWQLEAAGKPTEVIFAPNDSYGVRIVVWVRH